MSLWPGERNPGRDDVRDANELPDSTFLQLFKSALLSNSTATENTQRQGRKSHRILKNITPVHVTGAQDGNPNNLSYPVALLDGCPRVPLASELEALRIAFFEGFRNHVFFNAVYVPGSSQEILPPYLDLAFACLASTQLESTFQTDLIDTGDGSTRSSRLFLTATRLWNVIVEIDNREARRMEAVLSISLLATYGVLSANMVIWQSTSIQLGYLEPMIRRLRLHDHGMECKPKNVTTEARDRIGPLMMYIFLLDTVRGLHFNTTTLFVTSELFFPMSNDTFQFNTIYSNLMAKVPELPGNLTQTDGLFLLVALTADLILVNKSFRGVLPEAKGSLEQFIPFSPECEYGRMLKTISTSLDCWRVVFLWQMDNHTRALYNFCRLLHDFPLVCELPKLAEYSPASNAAATEALDKSVPEAPDKAVDYAWQILENASSTSTQGSLAPIWLPIVTFLAALTIWSKLRSGSCPAKSGLGSLRILSLFITEIERMSWPCCREMSQTLHSLMATPLAH
jgi:hypothetical protein